MAVPGRAHTLGMTSEEIAQREESRRGSLKGDDDIWSLCRARRDELAFTTLGSVNRRPLRPVHQGVSLQRPSAAKRGGTVNDEEEVTPEVTWPSAVGDGHISLT